MEAHQKTANRSDVVIAEAESAVDYGIGRAMFEEYAAAIDVDLCFQDFAAELDRLSVMYGPPAGALFLARSGAETLGCVGLRRFRDDVCEMKRLYVRSEFRRQHVGRRLANHTADRARALGYRAMVLDTLGTMEAARALYLSLGFKPSEAYYTNPIPGVQYFALNLKG